MGQPNQYPSHFRRKPSNFGRFLILNKKTQANLQDKRFKTISDSIKIKSSEGITDDELRNELLSWSAIFPQVYGKIPFEEYKAYRLSEKKAVELPKHDLQQSWAILREKIINDISNLGPKETNHSLQQEAILWNEWCAAKTLYPNLNPNISFEDFKEWRKAEIKRNMEAYSIYMNREDKQTTFEEFKKGLSITPTTQIKINLTKESPFSNEPTASDYSGKLNWTDDNPFYEPKSIWTKIKDFVWTE